MWVMLVAALTGSAFLQPAQAQAPADTSQTEVRVVLDTGAELVGQIVEENADTVTVLTRDGVTATVDRDRITGIYPLGTRQGLRPDPNRTRLLFAPTGRAVPQGQGYLADYYIFFPFVGVGVAEGVTLSGGFSLVPGLSLSSQLFYIAPKVTVWSSPTVHVAVGGVVASVLGEGAGGILFTVATFGPATSAATVGLGVGAGGGEVADRPVVLLGYEHQLSNNVKLLTENYVLPFEGAEGLVLSGGIRFMGRALAADFGLVTVANLIGDGAFPFVPTISFAYNFGV
ncbi:MAG: hypothetical protein AAGI71_16560 [Bacteroidota bacterium]